VTTDLGLRERKKHETRAAIARAALDLAVERGPSGVTVDDIAAAAGVSPRTVFNHFGTKDEAILGISPERRAELLEAVRARPADEPPLQAIAEVFTTAMTASDETATFWLRRAALVAAHPDLRVAQLASQDRLQQELAAVVAERTGLDPDTDPYPELVVAAALAALRIALARAAHAGPDRIRQAIEDAVAVLASGLAPPAS